MLLSAICGLANRYVHEQHPRSPAPLPIVWLNVRTESVSAIKTADTLPIGLYSFMPTLALIFTACYWPPLIDEGLEFELIDDGSSYRVRRYTGAGGVVDIPAFHNGNIEFGTIKRTGPRMKSTPK